MLPKGLRRIKWSRTSFEQLAKALRSSFILTLGLKGAL
jgi:hypothetical protein